VVDPHLQVVANPVDGVLRGVVELNAHGREFVGGSSEDIRGDLGLDETSIFGSLGVGDI
jgi:hypothetical protein